MRWQRGGFEGEVGGASWWSCIRCHSLVFCCLRTRVSKVREGGV